MQVTFNGVLAEKKKKKKSSYSSDAGKGPQMYALHSLIGATRSFQYWNRIFDEVPAGEFEMLAWGPR